MIALIPLHGLAEIAPGDDLVAAILAAGSRGDGDEGVLRDGDVLVVSQKIVSKAEGRLVRPRPDEDPALARRRIAREEAVRVVADTPEVLVVETAHGFVCANAGIDASNVPGGFLALLPEDPDASARRLREGIRAAVGVDVAVVVSDTFGRPWRMGQTDVAIGVSGIAPLRDERGGTDRDGHVLEVTEIAVADQIAGAADLVRRKADGVPVVIVRGLEWVPDERAGAGALVRRGPTDLFPRGRGGLAAVLAEPPPERWTGGVRPEDLGRALATLPLEVEVEVEVDAGDGPTRILVAGSRLDAAVRAGLLVAVLVDQGYRVTWVTEGPPGSRTGVTLVAGR